MTLRIQAPLSKKARAPQQPLAPHTLGAGNRNVRLKEMGSPSSFHSRGLGKTPQWAMYVQASMLGQTPTGDGRPKTTGAAMPPLEGRLAPNPSKAVPELVCT